CEMIMYLSGVDLVGGSSSDPALPNVISLDLYQPLKQLYTLTNNLYELAAPAELCVRKAIELISTRTAYELNVECFRMELLNESIGEAGAQDVDALIKGITCVCEHLLTVFSKYMSNPSEFFPYEFYMLHKNRYLFLNKIIFDASIPAVRPATVIQP